MYRNGNQMIMHENTLKFMGCNQREKNTNKILKVKSKGGDLYITTKK